MKKLKPLPKFKSEAAERAFWGKHNSTEYLDWAKAEQAVFPNLKPSTKMISLRLPEALLHKIKAIANKQDVPYQSFIKVLLERSVLRK